ncbi:MAG: hypothetical protein OJF49_000325 [Ktedonobacterales bacterium]|nr:MAG: hypothetical protein OJF49_000325 [Ktedonobacterales bacterium]
MWWYRALLGLRLWTWKGSALSPENLAALQRYVEPITEMPDVVAVQSLVTVDHALGLADYQQLCVPPSVNPQIAGVAAQLRSCADEELC